jgi:anti-sigma factor RsiW
MQHLDEGTIHAWLDGELPSAEREELEAHIASCEQCAAAVAEARGFVAGSSRILTALDTVPGGVLPKSDAVTSKSSIAPRKRFMVSRAWMAVAAVLVLSTVTVIARRPGQDDKLANIAFHQDTQPAGEEGVQRAAPAAGAGATVNEPSAATSAAPAAVPLAKTRTNASAQPAPAAAGGAASTYAVKNDARDRVARKDVRTDVREKKESFSNAPASLDAASPAPAAKPQLAPAEARARREIDALSDTPAVQVPMPSSPESALAHRLTHERVRDSIRLPTPLASVVVTGEGATSTNQKLGAPIAADSSAVDSAAPQLVSRKTSSYDEGDTVVTSVYKIGGAAVTLIDWSRPPARIHIRGLARQPSLKLRDTVPQVDSITWSDSSGHTRTLRGAVSREQLERIRAALFGATP